MRRVELHSLGTSEKICKSTLRVRWMCEKTRDFARVFLHRVEKYTHTRCLKNFVISLDICL